MLRIKARHLTPGHPSPGVTVPHPSPVDPPIPRTRVVPLMAVVAAVAVAPGRRPARVPAGPWIGRRARRVWLRLRRQSMLKKDAHGRSRHRSGATGQATNSPVPALLGHHFESCIQPETWRPTWPLRVIGLLSFLPPSFNQDIRRGTCELPVDLGSECRSGGAPRIIAPPLEESTAELRLRSFA